MNNFDKTSNGISYDWWVTGPDGAHFELYPEKGTHTEEDIKEAKADLRKNHDIVGIKITWRDLR